MNLSFPQILFAAIGSLLLYSAVTGKMPNAVVKTHLNGGKTPDPVKSGAASADGSSGHNYDMVGTQMIGVPVPNVRHVQMHPVVN